MPEDNSVKDRFLAWLSGTVSPAQLSDLYVVFDDVERYCISMRIVTKPILSITNLDVIKNVIGTLEKDRSFRNHFKRNLAKIDSFLKPVADTQKRICVIAVLSALVDFKFNAIIALRVAVENRVRLVTVLVD